MKRERNQFSYASLIKSLSLSVLSKYFTLIHPERKRAKKQKAVINLDTALSRMLFLD